jgi:hypothetical protein
MSPNRIVAVLTPLVFAPLAGVAATWAAKNLPGVDVPPDKIEQIFIAGALIALAPALQWLHGWQKYEQRRDEAVTAANDSVALAPVAIAAAPRDEIEFPADEYADVGEIDELEDFDEFEDTSILENGRLIAAGA